jgi:large subunit ribosomal protein L21
VTLDRIKADANGKIELPALLLVDGDKVTTDAAALAKVKVTAEVLNDLRGPKIIIQKYKNKTGYKKRQGFRAELTRVQVKEIK